MLALAANGCAFRSQVASFDGPEPPPVLIGHYQAGAKLLYGPSRYDTLIARLRSDVESHEMVLRRLVRRYIDIKSPLEFNFGYAAVDTTAGVILLRFFAPHPTPLLVAGWQVQLVYRLPGGPVVAAYVEEVPLE